MKKVPDTWHFVAELPEDPEPAPKGPIMKPAGAPDPASIPEAKTPEFVMPHLDAKPIDTATQIEGGQR
jgi:hypothetical protein